MNNDKYILDGTIPKPVDDLLEWGHWMQNADRKVRRTEYNDKITISTVFLGLDHNFGSDGPPILFETMVFGGKLHEGMSRYSSWEGAVTGHEEWVKKVAMAESGHSPD